MELPSFTALEEAFEDFDMYLSDSADMNKKDNPQKIISYGNKLLKQYEDFKTQPEVQTEKAQEIIDLGIKHVQDILKLAEKKS